jgi:DNA-binding CsgD family transcriptional regulator
LTIRKISPRAKAGSLTPREEEVTRWLAEGNQTAEVAILMGISLKTVEIHACNSMRKLGAPNRAQLTRAAIRECIVPCPRLERTEGFCRAVEESRPMITTLDETKSVVGHAGTIQGLREELKIVQAQLARSKDKERELRRLIAAANRRSDVFNTLLEAG